MKNFRKHENGGLICEECGLICKSRRGLGPHIVIKHNSQEYFDKWLKEETDGVCKICNKNTEYVSTSCGYKKCCCEICKNKYIHLCSTQGVKLKYGCDNVFQSEIIKQTAQQTKLEKYGNASYTNTEKMQQTKLERYGDVSYVNPEKAQQTKLEKYGNAFYTNIEKIQQTKLERYGDAYFSNWEKSFATNLEKTGFKYTFQSETVRLKGIETNKEKYGVENCQQDREIHEKTLKTALKLQKFMTTNLWYQGSYELDFLNTYYFIFNIQRGPSIKYTLNNTNKIYHSDFYIPSLNLIIEIKSFNWYKLNKTVDDAKKEGTIKAGYNYLMILDKNYKEFQKKYQIIF